MSLRPGQIVVRDSLAGLRDKLYWRPVARGVWHCFKRARIGKGRHFYLSLCEAVERPASGGQSCARPPVMRRCPRCDVAEITRRGADKSLDESPGWREYDR